MKKTIRKGLGLLLLLGSMNSFSQEKPTFNKELQQARLQLMQGYKNYNPQAALATFEQQAAQGNAEAMNGLGLIYSQGLGVTVNETLAIEWFNKAGENNYPKAYVNLAKLYKEGAGVPKDVTKALAYYQKAANARYRDAYFYWGEMVKEGLGTPQDYPQAMAIFQQGADLGSGGCLYAVGFMTYKGLGTKQDYKAAVTLFEQGVAKNSPASMYMLGLCYRNGYGVEKNEQQALTLLKKSAALGYKFAHEELEETLAENKTPNQTKTLSIPIVETDDAPIVAPLKLTKVKQKLTKEDISGTYTGTLVRYDYSGQNVISRTPITVSFEQDGKALTGTWVEQAGDSINFEAKIQNNRIAFSNSKIERLDHFSNKQLKTYEFREAQLQVVTSEDNIYIVGNLQLYDVKEKDPEKPMYLILERKNDDILPTDSQVVVSKLLVYPNPVTANQFNLYFDLAQQTPITVKIYDMMGMLKHEQLLTITETGQQNQTIAFSATSGNYILNLYYGSHIIKTILIKQ